jgi:hypothetical protein
VAVVVVLCCRSRARVFCSSFCGPGILFLFALNQKYNFISTFRALSRFRHKCRANTRSRQFYAESTRINRLCLDYRLSPSRQLPSEFWPPPLLFRSGTADDDDADAAADWPEADDDGTGADGSGPGAETGTREADDAAGAGAGADAAGEVDAEDETDADDEADADNEADNEADAGGATDDTAMGAADDEAGAAGGGGRIPSEPRSISASRPN